MIIEVFIFWCNTKKRRSGIPKRLVYQYFYLSFFFPNTFLDAPLNIFSAVSAVLPTASVPALLTFFTKSVDASVAFPTRPSFPLTDFTISLTVSADLFTRSLACLEVFFTRFSSCSFLLSVIMISSFKKWNSILYLWLKLWNYA